MGRRPNIARLRRLAAEGRLIRAAQHPDVVIRTEAIRALGSLSMAQIRPSAAIWIAVQRALLDEAGDVWMAAEEVLSTIRPSTAMGTTRSEAERAFLRGPDPELQRVAARRILEADDPRALVGAIRAAENECFSALHNSDLSGPTDSPSSARWREIGRAMNGANSMGPAADTIIGMLREEPRLFNDDQLGSLADIQDARDDPLGRPGTSYIIRYEALRSMARSELDRRRAQKI